MLLIANVDGCNEVTRTSGQDMESTTFTTASRHAWAPVRDRQSRLGSPWDIPAQPPTATADSGALPLLPYRTLDLIVLFPLSRFKVRTKCNSDLAKSELPGIIKAQTDIYAIYVRREYPSPGPDLGDSLNSNDERIAARRI